jgi:hypothetical protein
MTYGLNFAVDQKFLNVHEHFQGFTGPLFQREVQYSVFFSVPFFSFNQKIFLNCYCKPDNNYILGERE